MVDLRAGRRRLRHYVVDDLSIEAMHERCEVRMYQRGLGG
jgi:hypothetical protein